eukprot:5472546-Pleurochrysis_carterae.AAC.5
MCCTHSGHIGRNEFAATPISSALGLAWWAVPNNCAMVDFGRSTPAIKTRRLLWTTSCRGGSRGTISDARVQTIAHRNSCVHRAC